MAWTRAHPGGEFPKSSQAAWDSRSVSQYRLPNRNNRVSSGRFCTGICWAAAVTSSGLPVSLTIASVESRIWPGGATIRVHQLPKPSR
jgi:hypothetical protein